MGESLSFLGTHPIVRGDVHVAPFLQDDTSGKWMVSVNSNHFLSDEITAKRISALGCKESVDHSSAYAVYARTIEEPGAISDFVLWCEVNRARLEDLGRERDEHPLKFRILLISSKICERICKPLQLIFNPTLACAVITICVFVFFITSSNFRPETSLAGFWLGVALALWGVLIHELGHVAASLRYGVAQGGIGVGLYWIWPAFYADVRRTWRLAPMERAIVSAGGLYFQSIYVAALILIHAQSGSGALAFATNISMMMMLTTLNPIFKFDGYWLISDLTGNYNLHRKIGINRDSCG